jgi:selenide,water dikinase
VTGVVHPDRVIRNVGVQPGDALVLTKPLGTGIVTTALKQRKASRSSVQAAVTSMITLNRTASLVARPFPLHACSDVTGFGLLGHAVEMAMGSGVSMAFEAKALPVLPGALRLAKAGYLTGGCKRNRAYLADKVTIGPSVPAGYEDIAFDPQTSGGLLMALPAGRAGRLVQLLRARGVLSAAIVGWAISRGGPWVTLR